MRVIRFVSLLLIYLHIRESEEELDGRQKEAEGMKDVEKDEAEK